MKCVLPCAAHQESQYYKDQVQGGRQVKIHTVHHIIHMESTAGTTCTTCGAVVRETLAAGGRSLSVLPR